MKIKDIRISNTSELKSYLNEEKVSYPQNSTLDQLRAITRKHIEDKDAGNVSGEENPPVEPDTTKEGEQTPPAEPEADVPADMSKIAPNADGSLSEAAPVPPEPAPPLPPETTTPETTTPEATPPATKGKGKGAAKVDMTVPGARRDLPLQDLLDELAKRGFQHKQELADLLEATQREQKWLTHLKNEHKAREEEVAAGELKLEQRMADFDKNAIKIHADKDEAARMLDEAVRIRDEIARKTK